MRLFIRFGVIVKSLRSGVLNFNKIYAKLYFWRTKHKQKIDLLEEKEGKLFAYEFKWNPNKKFNFTPSLIKAYPNTEKKIITKENYLDFVT